MSKNLVPNPPSREAAQVLIDSANENRKFQITPAVREAIRTALGKTHYDETMTYFMGGRITGSKLADGYAFAGKLVEWEIEGGSTMLRAAIERGDILLNDIVKRIPAEMRKLKFAVEGWVCTGTLIEKIESPDLKTVNG